MPAGNHRKMQPEHFIEDGYLHEVNRLVLHPLGLALEVNPEDGALAVWDCREDPEGVYYGPDLLNGAKARSVCDLMLERRGSRIKALGYVVQPIPDARVLTTNSTDPADKRPTRREWFDGIGEVEFDA